MNETIQPSLIINLLSNLRKNTSCFRVFANNLTYKKQAVKLTGSNVFLSSMAEHLIYKRLKVLHALSL